MLVFGYIYSRVCKLHPSPLFQHNASLRIVSLFLGPYHLLKLVLVLLIIWNKWQGVFLKIRVWVDSLHSLKLKCLLCNDKSIYKKEKCWPSMLKIVSFQDRMKTFCTSQSTTNICLKHISNKRKDIIVTHMRRASSVCKMQVKMVLFKS